MINSRSMTSVPASTHKEIKEIKEIKNMHNDTHALDSKIEQAAQLAESTLAKYVFNPAHREKFKKLLASKTPSQLVLELNMQTVSNERFEQFKIFTSNQGEYAALFDLPPAQWMAILLEEKIAGDDLAALIGSSDMLEGAVSGMLNTINELCSPLQRVKILFFLNNSADASDDEIKNFLRNVRFPEADTPSMLALHHILHNVREPHVEGLSIGTRAATESILRIKPPASELSPEARIEIEHNNRARVKAALRIMKECITNNYEKALTHLSPTERATIQLEQDAFLARQLDEESARQLGQELNGELSSREIPSQPLPAGGSHTIMLPNSMLAGLMMLGMIQAFREDKEAPHFMDTHQEEPIESDNNRHNSTEEKDFFNQRINEIIQASRSSMMAIDDKKINTSPVFSASSSSTAMMRTLSGGTSIQAPIASPSLIHPVEEKPMHLSSISNMIDSEDLELQMAIELSLSRQFQR